MSAILNTFTGKNITPKNEAVIYDTAIGESGVFNGCALASLGSNQVSIAAGDGIIKGRKFTIEAETIACALATAGTMPGRIYLKMDLSNATTPLEIKTVVASTLPALVKDEDCNFTNGIYEVAIGTYTASTTAVSNLVPVFNQINLHAILKTKAEVTANTEPGRLADALVVKEIITNLNAEIDKKVYSETEKRVGTWIDGKPLYRKTISTTITLGATTAVNLAHGISNVGHIAFVNGYFIYGVAKMILPYMSGETAYNCGISIDTTNIRFGKNSATNWGSVPIVITIEYTKTTD